MRDASSPRQATSSGRRTARPNTSAKEADITEFVDVPGGRIAYEVTGSGPLLSYGIGVRRKDYRFLAPMLAQAGYRVASADLRTRPDLVAGIVEINPFTKTPRLDLGALLRVRRYCRSPGDRGDDDRAIGGVGAEDQEVPALTTFIPAICDSRQWNRQQAGSPCAW